MKDFSDDLPEWKRKLRDRFMRPEKPAPLQFPTDPVPSEADLRGAVANKIVNEVLEKTSELRRLINSTTERNAYGTGKAYNDLTIDLIGLACRAHSEVRRWMRALGGY
jgi:hypothetical protein